MRPLYSHPKPLRSNRNHDRAGLNVYLIRIRLDETRFFWVKLQGALDSLQLDGDQVFINSKDQLDSDRSVVCISRFRA